jgi:hypothetical protein
MNSKTLSFIVQVIRRTVLAEICLAFASGITLVLLQNFGFFATVSDSRFTMIFLGSLLVVSGISSIGMAIFHDYLNKKLIVLTREEERNARRRRKN